MRHTHEINLYNIVKNKLEKCFSFVEKLHSDLDPSEKILVHFLVEGLGRESEQ